MTAQRNGHTNGYLSKEQFLQLSTKDLELEGLGTFLFRKIGSAEYEALWPMPPVIAETWPKVTLPPDPAKATAAEIDELVASRKARREAEAAWLRTLPQVEQAIWRSAANDVAFRVISACCKAPLLSVDDARALGDAADTLYTAILLFSGLLRDPVVPAPPAAEPADSVTTTAQ